MPWKLPAGVEVRDAADATDSVVSAILANAAGAFRGDATATATVEAAAGLVGRAFASASASAPIFTPYCLGMIGRALIRRGEIVLAIGNDAGEDLLIPASSWTVTGGYDPRSWAYLVHLPGPSDTMSVTLPAAAVLHFRYSSDPAAPWRGRSPLDYAASSGKLTAATIKTLADEAAGPHGYVLPLPQADGADESLDHLKRDLAAGKGGLSLVESMADAWQSGERAPPQQWETKRYGASPPAALVQLQGQASKEILSACGLSPALFDPSVSAGASREAWRQALFSLIAPLGRQVEGEVRSKLYPEFALDFAEIRAADITGRARAWRSLVGKDAAMPEQEAAGIVGFGE